MQGTSTRSGSVRRGGCTDIGHLQMNNGKHCGMRAVRVGTCRFCALHVTWRAESTRSAGAGDVAVETLEILCRKRLCWQYRWFENIRKEYVLHWTRVAASTNKLCFFYAWNVQLSNPSPHRNQQSSIHTYTPPKPQHKRPKANHHAPPCHLSGIIRSSCHRNNSKSHPRHHSLLPPPEPLHPSPLNPRNPPRAPRNPPLRRASPSR